LVIYKGIGEGRKKLDGFYWFSIVLNGKWKEEIGKGINGIKDVF
jgi:hypothetical protein